MKNTIKKTLGLLLVVAAITITLTGASHHHNRPSVNDYLDHPALQQLAIAWQ